MGVHRLDSGDTFRRVASCETRAGVDWDASSVSASEFGRHASNDNGSDADLTSR